MSRNEIFCFWKVGQRVLRKREGRKGNARGMYMQPVPQSQLIHFDTLRFTNLSAIGRCEVAKEFVTLLSMIACFTVIHKFKRCWQMRVGKVICDP